MGQLPVSTGGSEIVSAEARRHVPTATGAGTRDTAAVSPPPAPYVTITVASSITGYSAKAIRRKIENGVWLEGRDGESA